jgi:hypothetical protein
MPQFPASSICVDTRRPLFEWMRERLCAGTGFIEPLDATSTCLGSLRPGADWSHKRVGATAAQLLRELLQRPGEEGKAVMKRKGVHPRLLSLAVELPTQASVVECVSSV